MMQTSNPSIPTVARCQDTGGQVFAQSIDPFARYHRSDRDGHTNFGLVKACDIPLGELNTSNAATRSAKLRMFRRRSGLKQWALADLLGVDQSTVSRWERGSRPIEDRIWRKLRSIGMTGHDREASPIMLAGTDLDKHWPALIRHYRAVHKISQERLSEILGFTPDSVRRWESGQWKPSLGSQIRLNDVILTCIETVSLLRSLAVTDIGMSGTEPLQAQPDEP